MAAYATLLQTQQYLNGRWQDGGKAKVLDVKDKYTQDTIAELPLASKAQIDKAIADAQKGFAAYRSWSAEKRADNLNLLAAKLEANQAAFARLIVAEAGKPLPYARTEVQRGLTTLRTAAAEALRLGGEVVPIDFDAGVGKTAFTKRVPIGPVAGITPFNFPLNLMLHKVAPALAVGNSIVIKPASATPLTALAFAQLIDALDYPEGTFQVLVAKGRDAQQLVEDERIRMLSFTGSDKVGWQMKADAGKKHIALELGGNAALIVDASADVGLAAKRAAVGSFLYAGQICISTQRVFVHDEVYETFKTAFLAETEKLLTGDPNQDNTTNGPLISADDVTRTADWVKEALDNGATMLTGGEILSKQHNLYAPTILTNVAPDMKVAAEEAFAPVAVVERVPDFATAIRRTNDSRYGLQAGVYTNDFAHVQQAHNELDVGGVIINDVPGFRNDAMPYGGVKDSGFGREGVKYAMQEMTEPRLLVY